MSTAIADLTATPRSSAATRTSSRCSASAASRRSSGRSSSGAANDNLFKFAFTVMVTYQLQVSWLPPAMAGLVIGALFILPFLLFSATSGQLADKFDKTTHDPLREEPGDRDHAARRLGLLHRQRRRCCCGCIFLMGLHSTLFGPVKFAYLPQAWTSAS